MATRDLAREELKRRIEKAGTQKAVANELGISLSFLNDIIKRRRNVSLDVLAKLGMARVIADVPRGRVRDVTQAIASVLKEGVK